MYEFRILLYGSSHVIISNLQTPPFMFKVYQVYHNLYRFHFLNLKLLHNLSEFLVELLDLHRCFIFNFSFFFQIYQIHFHQYYV